MHRPGLHLVDVRLHGGFQQSAEALLPAGALDDSLGYRHMVRPPHTPFSVSFIKASRFPDPSPLPHQCHFMSMLWFRALADYDYAMRVDEDVCIMRLPAAELRDALSADY
eukprot:7379585-Prymnesium_polylepis.1